jgi:hypothetical protein
MITLQTAPRTSSSKMPDAVRPLMTNLGSMGMAAAAGNQGFKSGMFVTDFANKKSYVFSTHNVATWFFCDRYDYGFVGNDPYVQNRTSVGLSGFGTFTSAPQFFVFHNRQNTRHFIYFHTNGGSGSIVAQTLYEFTFSGLTLTLGSSVSLPVIGSYAPCFAFAENDLLYVWYRNTSTGLVDTGRKWDRSTWTTLAGNALPSVVNGAIAESATYDFTQAWSPWYLCTLPRFPVNGAFYKYFTTTAQCLRFNVSAETWVASESPYTVFHTDKNFILTYSSVDQRYWRLGGDGAATKIEWSRGSPTRSHMASDWENGLTSAFSTSDATTPASLLCSKPFTTTKKIRRLAGGVTTGPLVYANETIIQDGAAYSGFAMYQQVPELVTRDFRIKPTSGTFRFWPISTDNSFPATFWLE